MKKVFKLFGLIPLWSIEEKRTEMNEDELYKRTVSRIAKDFQKSLQRKGAA